MPTLVVGGDEALLVVHQTGPLLRAGDDSVDRFVEDSVVDDLRILTGGEQGRLIEDVGKVRTGESGGALGDLPEVDLFGQRFVRRVDLEDVLTALHVRGFDGDLPIEAARAQQRRVEDVGQQTGRVSAVRPGHVRNHHMVSLGADLCLAFPLGESRGTRGCMAAAHKAGIPVRNHGDS